MKLCPLNIISIFQQTKNKETKIMKKEKGERTREDTYKGGMGFEGNLVN